MTTDNDIYINKATRKEFKARCTMRLQENTYFLEPIDDNPMPRIEPGDCVQILRNRKGWYGVEKPIYEYECVRVWDCEGYRREFKISDITSISKSNGSFWEQKP